jgi:hypothetical protein
MSVQVGRPTIASVAVTAAAAAWSISCEMPTFKDAEEFCRRRQKRFSGNRMRCRYRAITQCGALREHRRGVESAVHRRQRREFSDIMAHEGYSWRRTTSCTAMCRHRPEVYHSTTGGLTKRRYRAPTRTRSCLKRLNREAFRARVPPLIRRGDNSASAMLRM